MKFIRLTATALAVTALIGVASAQYTPGLGGRSTPIPEPTIEYVYVEVPHPADACHEDEDWVVVHHETPNAFDRNNGTRMCQHNEDVALDVINQLVKDGWLSWAWDLPDAPAPWTGGTPSLLD